jgi:hypothetical protein
VAWARQFDKPVLLVAGNHEFYGGSIDGTLRELRSSATALTCTFLDDDELVLEGVRFLGSTLWTDFNLFGAGERKTAAVDVAARLLRDFSRIRREEAGAALFTPADAAARFERHAAWLAARLAAPHHGPTVVITHHAPSPRSIHPRFADSLLNACFVSDRRRCSASTGCSSGSTATRTTASTTKSAAPASSAIRAATPLPASTRNAAFDPHLVLEVPPRPLTSAGRG